ncbi:MAG: alpha/beta hydrolase [Spirochaetae bacterium HGW-Spirochaetae-3]|jgi:branched-chain amino acid transport system permease protein|nr:MAG: alpha/beta hydrolase [Spirochaetae bacterium HGW-Spirochaetae-3]
MEGKFVSVFGKKVYYVENGEGAPVVYVHGNWGSSVWWSKVMAVPGRRVIALDMPNFGRSDSLDVADIGVYAEYLGGFIDAIGLENADIVGHSLGGAVVMALIAARPEIAASVMLVDSAAPSGLVTPESHYAAFERFATNRDALRAGLKGAAPTITDMEFLDAITDDARLMARHAFVGNARALEKKTPVQRLSAFKGPVLVVWGRKDVIVNEDMARETAEAFARGRLEILDEIGHSVMAESPALFSRLLIDFLSAR